MSDSDTTSGSAASFQVGCSVVCDVVRKPKRKKRKSRSLHRLLGMISALPLVWVLLTGLVLNHSEDFGLDSVELESPLILSAYGMTPAGGAESLVLHGHSITSWDGVVFFDQRPLDLEGEIITALPMGDGMAIVSDSTVLRVDFEGSVIEKLDELSLPSIPLLEAGIFDGKMALRSSDSWHVADADWIEFSAISETVTPIRLQPLEDGDLKEALRSRWSGGGVSLSRFVLDLHAGNFLGSFAAYFYDFVVLCTLWLIATGIILQYRTNRRG
ncbi:PepSY domain-containing protein [Rubritalea profundi]|uniref:PepSY domain-containing protein n=1 Tax=Rubritalea profundi TaxID=1658618 RepID=A0A2S7U4D4_9BACT|nr:PepSY domain-containing protein [Rubritalea profundi]PQJ29878.1 hypothetical protein BSZ32_16235 [Rubritalea profundi]